MKIRVTVESKGLTNGKIYDVEEVMYMEKFNITQYVIINDYQVRIILGQGLCEVINEDTFKTSIGQSVKITYSIPDEKIPYKTTMGIVENIGGNRVWITNSNGCLECFRFQDIMQMFNIK